MIRLFSRKQFLMEEWQMRTVSALSLRLMSLPNLLELSFLMVLALPNTSRMGSHLRILFSMFADFSCRMFITRLLQQLTALSACLLVSVFPDPDSPLILITCVLSDLSSPFSIWNMKEKMCGSCFRMSSPFKKILSKQVAKHFSEYCSGISRKGLTMMRLFQRQVCIFCSANLLFNCISTSGALIMSIQIRSLSILLLSLHRYSWCAFTSKDAPFSVVPVTLELARLIDSGTSPLTTPRTKRSVSLLGWKTQQRVSLVIQLISTVSLLAGGLQLLIFKFNMTRGDNRQRGGMCDYRWTGLQLNSRTMGNQQASETNLSLTSQEREDWVKVEDQGYCELWANRKTNRRFQAYPISDATARDNVQIQKFAFRKIHNAYLVSAEAVITQNQSFLCSEPVTSFVLIQNITGRLRSYARALTFEEALYVLSSSATGYNTLCSFFGPLEPNEDLICFNDEGQVKVWLNQNLSKNEASVNAKSNEFQPIINDDYGLAKRRSRACVQKLLKIVEVSSQQGYPRVFQEETRNLSTFFEISNFVDYFCEKNNIQIPDRIRLNRNNVNTSVQSRQIINPPPIPTRSLPVQSVPQLQSTSSLQSSRVNRVFQSNHQRDGVVPVISNPPLVQFGSNPPFRYPVQQIIQPAPRWVQNHTVSYVYTPIVQQPPQPIIISVPPPPTVIIPSPPVTVEIPPEPVKEVVVVEQPEKVIIEVQAKKQMQPLLNDIPVSQSNENIEANEEEYHESSHFQQEEINIPKIEYHYTQEPKEQEYVEEQQVNVEQINYQPEETHYQEYYQEEVNLHQPQYHEDPTQLQQQYRQYQTEKQQFQEFEQEEPKEKIASSVYSHIEQYVAPAQEIPKEVIEQRKQEDIPSPKKSFEIEDWEQRLTQFTQSNQKKHPRIEVQSVPPVPPVQNKQPESFKNLIVTDQKEEYVNELADLQTDDIEKYIRMKYQSYLNEKTESQPEENAEKAQKYLVNSEPYRPASNLYSNDYNYTNNYTSNYRTSDPYAEQETEQVVEKAYNRPYEYKPQQKWQVQTKEKENFPTSYNYDKFASDTNRISIDKDLQYSSSRRNEPSNFGAKYESQLDEINIEKYNPISVSKRVSQRSKGSRASNIIDEKYSKYVLNSQKPKRTIPNLNSEDVSVILPVDESLMTKYSARPIFEKPYEHDSFSNSKPAEQKGITYEKLRNLLWEQ